MKTVVFVAPQLSQPRIIKRIAAVQNGGCQVRVYGFDNGLYACNLANLPFPIEDLIPRKKEAARWKKMLFFYRVLRNILRANRGAIFYFFGYEIGLFAYLLRAKDYIYEEADVSAARIKNRLLRKLLIFFDRLIIKKSLYTVFTSGGFVDYLFAADERPVNLILLPNKLSPWFNKEKKEMVELKHFDYNHLVFGFIGLIRYPNTIIRFAKIIGHKFPQHEFHFYGDVERKEYIDEELLSFSNVYFHGPFVNPQDLQGIYSKIDVNVVCYDTASGNVNIAEPNKLYESVFFETPLVVSSGTYLAHRVKEMNAGYDIDASVDSNIIAFVEALHNGDLENIVSSMQKTPWENLVDNPRDLLMKLKSLL